VSRTLIFLGPLILGVVSYLLCILVPTRTIAHTLGLYIPASGTAILGGLTITYWVVLSELLYERGSAIITTLTLTGLLLITSPWYGIINPPWFSVIGLISLILMGLMIYIGKLLNHIILFSAVGLLLMHTTTWIGMILTKIINPEVTLIILSIMSIISGAIGGILAKITIKYLK